MTLHPSYPASPAHLIRLWRSHWYRIVSSKKLKGWSLGIVPVQDLMERQGLNWEMYCPGWMISRLQLNIWTIMIEESLLPVSPLQLSGTWSSVKIMQQGKCKSWFITSLRVTLIALSISSVGVAAVQTSETFAAARDIGVLLVVERVHQGLQTDRENMYFALSKLWDCSILEQMFITSSDSIVFWPFDSEWHMFLCSTLLQASRTFGPFFSLPTAS